MTAAGSAGRDDTRLHRRLRLAVHLVLGLVMVTLGIWAGLRWSLIAIEVDDRVVDTSWAEEGPAFKVLQLDDGTTLTIDDDLMDRMGGPEALTGQQLSSALGERVAVLDGRRISLALAPTAWRTISLLIVIAALSAVRNGRLRSALSPRGPSRSPTGRPEHESE